MEKLRNGWKRLCGLVRASRQLQIGLILLAVVLVVVAAAPALAPSRVATAMAARGSNIGLTPNRGKLLNRKASANHTGTRARA